MRILGLDISSSVTGWAIIDDKDTLVTFGEIQLSKFKKKAEPLKYMEVLYSEVDTLLKTYKPDKVFVENIHAKNMITMKVLARVRGVAELACLHNNIKSVTEVHPSHIRLVVLGKGNLKSEEICPILEDKYHKSLRTEGLDAIDAIMVALCGAIESQNAIT